MNYNKSTRYALYAAIEMAGTSEPVTTASLALRYTIPAGALAKVLQMLVRAGIAHGVRGVGGGYLLARSPADITVLDVIDVFEAPRQLGACLLAERHEPDCEHGPDCRLRGLFDEVDEQVRCTFASVTLETLARKSS